MASSEGTADIKLNKPKRTYDPYELPKVPRRTLLKQAAAVIGIGVAAGVGIGIPTVLRKEDSPAQVKTPYEILLDKGIVPKEIYIGNIKISKELNGIPLNVRSETNVESIVTSWLDIETYNGTNIKDVNEFIIKNCLFVEGQNVDPAGSKGKKGLWIVGSVNEEPRFISYSSITGSFVKPDGGAFQKVAEFSKAGLKTTTGEMFKPDQIGIVTPLPKAA